MKKIDFWQSQSLKDLKVPIISRMALMLSYPAILSKLLIVILFILSQFNIFLIVAKPTVIHIRSEGIAFSQVLNNICDAIFFEELKDVSNSSTNTIWILGVITIYLLMDVTCAMYLAVSLHTKGMVHRGVGMIYNAVTYIHNLALFYVIHVFCIKVLYVLFQKEEGLMLSDKSSELFVKVLCLMVLSCNAIWGILKILLFTVNIKTKNQLSTKTNILTLLDLAFRLAMPIIETFVLPSQTLIYAVLVVNLVYCFLRDYLLYEFLPYYKLSILKIATICHTIITSFSLAALISRPISRSRSYVEPDLLFPLWILFSLVLGKLYTKHLDGLILKILKYPNSMTNPYHLIHYVDVYKHFSKCNQPTPNSEKVQEKYLIYMSMLKQSATRHLLPSELDGKLDYKIQELIDQHFIKQHLELLNASIKKNSNNLMLKATLAHYYTKFEKLYVLATQILDAGLCSSLSLRNSAFLVKTIILEKLKDEDYRQDETLESDTLAVRKHVYLQENYKSIKNSIIEQLKSGIQFWKHFLLPDPDFQSLVNLADKAFTKAKTIKKVANQYRVFQAENFTTPILVYSLYFYFVQSDSKTAQKFFEEYSKHKLRRNHVNSSLHQGPKTSHFGSGSLYFVLSASQEQFGMILNCAGQVSKSFRITKEMLIKRQLSLLMPALYSKWYDDLLKTSLTNTDSGILNKTIEIPILMKDGYIVPHSLHITIDCIGEFGLCFLGLISPISDNKRRVIITRDGHILNMSRDFAEDLNIPYRKEGNIGSIYSLCPLLEKIVYNNNSNRNQDNFQNVQSIQILQEKEDNFKEEEIYLNFSPYVDKQEKLGINSIVHDGRQSIEYKVQIQNRAIQEAQCFELRMERMTRKPSSIIKSSTIVSTSKPLINKSTDTSNIPKTHSTNLQSYEAFPSLINEKFKFDTTEASPTLPPVKKRKLEVAKNNKLSIDTVTEVANSALPLTSPMSEGRKLISIAGGDKDDDIDINSSKVSSRKSEDSLSFDKETDKNNSQPSLNFISISDVDSGSFFSTMKKEDAFKVIRRAINSRSYRYSSRAYGLCFIGTVVLQMVFLIWLNFYTSIVSQNISNLSQVIQSSYFRSYWVKIANQDMLLWVAVRGNWLEYSLYDLVNAFTYDFERISHYNQELSIYLASLDNEIQEPFYQKDIRVYDRDIYGNLTLLTVEDSFEVCKRIINYGLINAHKPNETFTGPYIVDYESRFIAQNSLNDLQVVSETLTSFVETKLYDTLDSSKKTMKGAFVGALVVFGLFVIASLKFVHFLNRDSTNFMNILLTLSVDEITKNEHYLSAFKELLEKDSSDIEILNAFSTAKATLQRKITHKEDKTGNAKVNRKVNRRASMKMYNAKNYLIFIGLLVCLGLMTVFMVVYYILASNKIQIMGQQHKNLNSALNFVNIYATIMPELQTAILLNDTTTVKNVPVLSYIQYTANELTQVTELQTSLEDSNGQIPAVQQEILFNYSCTKSYTPYYSWSLEVLEPECNAISQGLEIVGLLNLILQVNNRLTQFLWNFKNLPRDIPGLIDRHIEAFDICFFTDIGFVLLYQSFAYSLETFGDLVAELEQERVVLAWIAVVLSLLLGAVTWMFIIRRLVRKEFEKKRMLALVPNKLIFGNYLLMKYVSNLK